MHAYGMFVRHGLLPSPGTWTEQSAAFVDGVSIADHETAAIARDAAADAERKVR